MSFVAENEGVVGGLVRGGQLQGFVASAFGYCKNTANVIQIADEITSDGGPKFTASAARDFLRQWGVHHRLSSFHLLHSPIATAALRWVLRLLRAL